MKKILISALAALLCLAAPGQIVNRLRVDQKTFLRYAYGRMQEFNPENLFLADSLYQAGVAQGNFRYKCLALSLEMPVLYHLGEYGRMDACVAEIKELLSDRKDLREFYFSTLHEYCEFLVELDRISEAMLEARAMERLASAEKKPVGKMYSYRILGLIQSYRDNSFLAIQNLEKAAHLSRDARAEQDLPNLYILLAQENVKMEQFIQAQDYLDKARQYLSFFPSLRLKVLFTEAQLAYAQGRMEHFWKCYQAISEDPLYTLQIDPNTRFGLDVTFLRSKRLFQQALSMADSLDSRLSRNKQIHGIYADMGAFDQAYDRLERLMHDKDSVYIKVQNEDLAILDAEMNNAQLREEAQRLKSQNQLTILIGFFVMFAIGFLSLIMQQWRLRANLAEMKAKNNSLRMARRAYQTALDAKEAENSLKIKILQNRKSNSFKL